MPFARVLVFALALTHAVGLADLVMDDACGDVCQDDGCGDDCLPGDACRCHCPSTMPLLGPTELTTTKVDRQRDLVPAWAHQRLHASPDPREILHVPKLAV